MFNLHSMSLFELNELQRIVGLAESRLDTLGQHVKAEQMCSLWLDIVYEKRCRKHEQEEAEA